MTNRPWGWTAAPSIPFFILSVIVLLAGCRTSGPSAPAASGEPDLSAYRWIYLRDGLSVQADEDLAEVIAVGDVNMGRGVSKEQDPLSEAAPWLRAADLAIGNLESAIAPAGEVIPDADDPASPEEPYLLVAPPTAADQLAGAGFDLLGMANNHALDRGLEGLADTGTALQTVDVTPLGAAPEPQQAYEAVIRRVGELRLAFLAYNAVPSPRGPDWSGEVRQTRPKDGWVLAGWDRERAAAAVSAARSQADAVIVSIHWGYEYDLRVDPAQREIARDLAAAGADLVIGHHPHVVQAVELLQEEGRAGELQRYTFAAYSLGNFVFDQGFDETGQGLALRAFFDGQGLRAVQALPVYAGLRPALMPPEAAEDLFERIAPEPEAHAWRCDGETCMPTAAPDTSQGGRFGSGESDLSGDGIPERVTLESGRAHITGEGLAEWTSPPEWWVLDLAAGDPNDDGRQELLLALQKPDSSGVLLSHPFLLGYREGSWRVLWGGSAVSDPIQEVELGDLDGDGSQELAVLEALHGTEERAVSVWRWHGWGFSQAWRSEPGQYTDLRLAEGDGEILVVEGPAGQP